MLCRIDKGYKPTEAKLKMLAKIRQLDLSYRSLRRLPDSIDMLTKLEYLNVSDNELTALPESIGKLVWLKELELDDCSNIYFWSYRQVQEILQGFFS